MLKGAALADLRIVWQTYSFGGCDLRDPETVEVIPPVVGGEYMVYLTKGKDGTFARLGYQWYFHMMPAAPNVRMQPWDNSWRGLIEVSPAVAGPGEAVDIGSPERGSRPSHGSGRNPMSPPKTSM